MNWLTSLFAPASQRTRKGQALASTHEAFAIPSSSPIFSTHVDFHADVDPDSATSFSYPPQGTSYGYLSQNSRPRPNSLLPIHHDALHTPTSPSAPYPPLAHTWTRLKNWLAREYPELGDTLNYGILPDDLAQLEMQFGFALPAVVRESYLAVDGQEAESAAGCSEGLFFGLTLLSLEDVYDEWKIWREVDEDPTTGGNPHLREMMESIPPDWIRKQYSQRGWIPLIADKTGNYIGVDLNPAEKGAVGQVIVFGRDFDTKVVLFNGDGPTGWAKWLATFADELESGEGFEIGAGEFSEGSEDDLGYESYFYDGTGRGQGDGGGDNGTGGLRLTGEYRGWNVLEAWADRSVRRWIECGVITEDIRISADDEKKGTGALVGIVEESAAEVAIPVVTEEATLSDNTAPKIPQENVPIISITKPPAPLPVDLPTESDIAALPSPPDSTRSFEDDLEAGHSRSSMKEQDPSFVPKSASTETGRSDSSDTTTPTSKAFQSTAVAAPPSPPPEVDLLVDTGPVLESTPIIQSSPLPVSSDAHFTVTDDVKESETDVEDPDVTIRLIGGGGTIGIAGSDEEEVEHEEIKDDNASVISSASEASISTGEKKHKKTRSGLAGLKKLGKLGGLRKKDSVSESTS